MRASDFDFDDERVAGADLLGQPSADLQPPQHRAGEVPVEINRPDHHAGHDQHQIDLPHRPGDDDERQHDKEIPAFVRKSRAMIAEHDHSSQSGAATLSTSRSISASSVPRWPWWT